MLTSNICKIIKFGIVEKKEKSKETKALSRQQIVSLLPFDNLILPIY